MKPKFCKGRFRWDRQSGKWVCQRQTSYTWELPALPAVIAHSLVAVQYSPATGAPAQRPR